VTDRIHCLTVVLKEDIRDDAIEPVVNAIRMVKGVLSVEQHVADHNFHAAEDRARHELGVRILKLVHAEVFPKLEVPR
jgi:hypothetical protein